MNGQSGQVVHLQVSPNGLLIQPLSAKHVDRSEALSIARQGCPQEGCYGYRQVLFIHRDGFIELWDKELRQ